MTSPRKKWNNDKRLEMERFHRSLAEDGDSQSQLFLAVKLLDEATSESCELKTETAIDMLIDLAIDGHSMPIKILEECLGHNIGITSKNKSIVLKLLTRKELDIKCENIANRIMNTICDDQKHRLKTSQFRHRLQRLVLQKNPSPISDNLDADNDLMIREDNLSLNLKRVFQMKSPSIELTDEANFRDIFSFFFLILRTAFKLIDLTFIISLLILFCLSLFLNYFYFKPNFRLLCEKFNEMQLFCLSLQLIEVYSFIKTIDRIYNFNNFKLWLKVIKAFDKECNIDPSKFFNNCLIWVTIFLVTLAIELNIEIIFDSDFPRTASVCSSLIRQMMAFLSFLVLIRNNSNLLQIFFVIFHYLSQNYLQEIQTNFPLVYSYLTNYTMIFSFFLVIITTKPILSSTSFNLILVPNLLAHILILSSDYNSESLNFMISNIFKNVHSIFGAVILLALLRLTQRLQYLTQIPRILIFTDFYKHFTQTFNWMSFLINTLIIAYISRRISRLSLLNKLTNFTIILISSFLFLYIVYYSERQIRFISNNIYSYDRYYDKCFDDDINHNITKQIECLEFTQTHKLQALSRINSIKLIQMSNNFRSTYDFLTLGFSDYIYPILPKKVQRVVNLYEWRVFEFQVIFLLKYSSTEVSVHLEHQDRDFVEKLKVGDIYEIEMFYDPIKSTAVLFSASCKTCWDVIQWNNTIYT